MKPKTTLALVTESLVNGDKEGASRLFSNYLKTAARRIVNQCGVVKEYDDRDPYGYDDDSEFDSTEELYNKVAALTVAGIPVRIKFSGVREVATRSEPQTFHNPGDSEIVRYGEIKLKYAEGLSIGSQLVFDGVAIMEDATAEDLMMNLNIYANELYDMVVSTNDAEPLPKNIMQTVTLEFCKKVVVAFAKNLQAREGDA